MTLILASASPRRLQLLKQIGIVPDQVISPEIDETPVKGELPDAYAKRMAEEKAKAVTAPGALVLAADTVVACGRRILPKAEDEETARACLTLLSGRRHRVYTALSLIVPPPVGGVGGGRNSIPSSRSCPHPNPPPMGEGVKSKLVMTHVRFRRLQPAEIDAYLAGGEWRGKAGGYAIQGSAEAFIPAINGSYSNVVGLPLAEVSKLLAAYGIRAIKTR